LGLQRKLRYILFDKIIKKGEKMNKVVDILRQNFKETVFEFSENRFKYRCFGVEDEIVDCFNYCEKINLSEKITPTKKLEDLTLVKESLIEAKSIEDKCLDLLGVYKDCEIEKNIIFLAKKKLKRVLRNIIFHMKLYITL